jgi:hypothetical protein
MLGKPCIVASSSIYFNFIVMFPYKKVNVNKFTLLELIKIEMKVYHFYLSYNLQWYYRFEMITG